MTQQAIAEQQEQEQQDTEIRDTAEKITDTLQQVFDMLVSRRDVAYEEAISALDREQAQLQQEYIAVEEAKTSLEKILPAKARIAQNEADQLAVAGKSEEAEAKRREQREAENAPARMKARQGEISARTEKISEEKKAVAKRIFEVWYCECQQVVRAAEHGLFCTLLDGLEQSFYEFQDRTNTGRGPDPRDRGLFHRGYLSGLTADERSAEWRTARKWYA
jgi:hypothetical protein